LKNKYKVTVKKVVTKVIETIYVTAPNQMEATVAAVKVLNDKNISISKKDYEEGTRIDLTAKKEAA